MSSTMLMGALCRRFGAQWLLSALLSFSLLMPTTAQAMNGYLSDMIASFANTSHHDTCGDCHSSWSGGKARGDLAVSYKMWDYSGTTGMSRAMRKIDIFNIGVSNDWKVLNDLSGDTGLYGEVATPGPYNFSGAADKDGDGYINMIYRTERAGMPINWADACSTCSGKSAGGNKGSMPSPPKGWDVDDNDATQGGIDWDWGILLLSDPTPNAQYDADAPLSNYWSSDTTPPNDVADLIVDVAQWPTASNNKGIPLKWTAPADDDPAIGGPDINVPVHHYDIRFTTEALLSTYNAAFTGLTPAKLCSASSEQSGQVPCQIRNHTHWHTMFHLSDCGVNNGSGQEHLMHIGVMDAGNANSCGIAGVSGWNRGIATPLMRALYESGFENEEGPGTQGLTFENCPPCGPKAPGSTETYLLTEVTNKHIDQLLATPYAATTAFAYTDPHDGTANTQPNYIADGTVYWIQLASDDSVVHPWVELTDVNGDAVVRGGPFIESGAANGFAGYEDPGFSEGSNIIAVKAGPYGAAITNVNDSDDLAPPVFADSADTAAQITITGIGFQAVDPIDGINAVNAYLVSDDNVTTVLAATTTTVDSDTQVTATFNLSGLFGEYTIELRNAGGKTVAAWVHAVDVSSTAPGEIVFDNTTFNIIEGPSVSASITVLRQGGSFGTASVDFTTTDGSAVNGGGVGLGDYDTVTQNISWLDGNNAPVIVTIPINDDAAIEPTETVNLTLSNVTGSGTPTLGTPSTAVLNIQDDELNPGSVQFVAASYTRSEAAGVANFLVERTGGTDGAVSINYTTVDGNATDGGGVGLGDYDASSGTLVWSDGVGGSQPVAVTINDDGVQELTEFFNISLGTPTGGVLIGVNNPTTVNITDNDTPSTLAFSLANYAITEGAVLATIDVERTGSTIGAVTVDYTTADNTAFNGGGVGLGDYDTNSGTLSWADAESVNKSFTVQINADTTDELNELISLSLSAPTGGAVIGAQNTATITINDDDSTLEFSASGFSRDENLTPATITVTRSDITVPPTYSGAVTVNYATADNTAVNGGGAGLGDYDTASGVLSWVDGESASKTFTIPINDDAVLEGDETVNLSLSAPTGSSALGTLNTATLTIVDDEQPGTLQFSSATYSINEDGGVDATITVTRVGGASGALTVDYATVDVDPGTTATVVSDYTSTSGTLSWANGDSASKTFTVPILNDSVDEDPDETIKLELTNATVELVPDGSILGAQNTASLTIVDSFGTLQFNSPTYSVAEDGGVAATITVTRVGGTNQAVSVNYATADATATSPADYTATSGTLLWADGESLSKTFTIPIINDALDEQPDEIVNLSLSGPTGGAQLGTQNTATLTIVDSVGTLQFDSPTYSVNEDGGVAATITVTRVGGSNGAASVNYATADGATNPAASGVDYTTASGTLSWADGNATAKTFTIPITNDAIDEIPYETIDLSLSTFVGANEGLQSAATLTIIDSFGDLQFDAPTYSVNEDGGAIATITVTRVGGTNGNVGVSYTTADNTALAPGDYTTASGTLSWAAGDPAPKSFTVTVLDDALDENPDEIINLSLSAPTGGAQLGAQSTATLTIIDSVGTLQFDSATYSVNEDGGVDATITVTRVGGSNGAASVNYATADGATNPAASGVDYTASSGTLSWADGIATAKTFTIPITNDAIDEDPDETVDLTLSAFVGAAEGSQSTATLTILDSFGKLQFDSATYSVNEDGGVDATITVTRVGGTNGAISVDYATADNTALAPGDYTATSSTLSWLDGEAAPKSFTIPIVNDAVYENPDETLSINLSNPLGGAQLGAPNTATLTIIDSPGDIEFSSATYSVNEDGGVSATIDVNRVGGSRGAASVNYASSDGTATAGVDYTGTSGTLSWLDNDAATKQITIPITNDIVIESNETVNLALSGIIGARAGTPTSAVLTIIDSVGRVEFVAAPYTVTEDTAGSVTITARRVEGSGTQFDVPYTTVDGTATTADSDYTLTTGTLTWLEGAVGNRTFAVPVTSDRNIESDEALTLRLSPPAQAQVDTTLTISNDDATGTVQFELASYSVNEDGINATITATRSGGDVGRIDVDYATTDGSALNGGGAGLGDYDTATGTLTWLDTDALTKSFTVAINDDAALEGGETINLTMSNPLLNSVSDLAVLGAPSTAILNITDNDTPGTVQFSAPTYTVDEDGGANAIVTVTRVGGNGGTITVDYATANGAVNPALAGTDYTAQSGTFTWNPADSTSRTISIPITNDALIESPDETIDLTLSNPTLDAASDPTVLGGQDTAILTIIDSYGTLQFDNVAYQVTEDGGVAAVITVTRVGGSNQAVSVAYATADNTATDGLDYSAASGTLNWADGDAASKTFNIPIINDAFIESPDETVNLTLSNPLGGAQLGTPNSAVLTIVDSAGDVQFSATNYEVHEDGSMTTTVTVTRTGGNNGVVEVQYATSDGSALVGVDYVASSGTLTWLSGDDTAKTFAVTSIDDTLDEDPDETINLTLSNPTLNAISEPAVLGAPNTATVTIIDSHGTMQFDSATYSVNEDGGADATITVTRTGGTNGALTVNYATSAATATAAVDYTSASGTLSWTDGDSTAKTFTVPVINDEIAEDPDETINLTLSNPTLDASPDSGVMGVQNTAVLTIIDSVGTLQFNSATYSVNEDGGVDATITVSRLGGSNGAASVDYATADGVFNPATVGSDYTLTAGTLNWTDGDTASKSFTIPITNDAIDESPDETIDLTLSNFVGAFEGIRSTATLTIIDSVGVLEFNSPTFSVNEDGGLNATITVSRIGGSNGAASVSYATADGAVNPATAGVDYTAASGIFNWADGVSGDKTFIIPINNDAIDEQPDETVDLTLSAAVGAPLGTNNVATLTIVDSFGTLQFDNTAYSIDEDGVGYATITVTRVGGSNGAASVNYQTADGTALAGSDYTATNSTLIWNDGDSLSKSFTIPITNDSADEADETINVTLNTFVGAAAGAPTAATLTIVDSVGLIQFSSATYSVAETGTNVTITVVRSGGSNGAASVNYATSDFTATSGVDYTARSGTFNWNSGDSTNRTFTIPVVDDVLVEGDEIVDLTLSSIVGAKVGSPTTATLTIVDNPGTVQFNSATYGITENGAGSITISVTRAGGSGGAVSVDYATADGSAQAIDAVAFDGDYDGASGTLNWAGGDPGTKTFTITINADLLIEGDETIGLSLSNAVGGVVIGSPNSSTVTITDSPGNLQFSAASYNVNEEGSGSATITVRRVEGSGGEASISYATADADAATTATAGLDYTSTTGILNWLNGDAADKTFAVPVASDAVIENPDEVIKLTLSGVTGAGIGAPIESLLTIIDGAGTLQFSSPSYSVSEAGVNAIVTVTRTGGSNGAASVNYTTANGSATSGNDYTLTSGSLNWVDGNNTAQNITIPLNNDAVVEGDETFTLTLTGSTGAQIGAQNTTTVAINDDDIAGNLEFTSALYSVNEDGAGFATITVRRTLGTVGVVNVNYATSDATATAANDYTAASGTLTWLDGSSADQSFVVNITPDTLIEAGGEVVNLTLSGATGGATLNQGGTAQQTAQLQIIDSAGSLRLSASDYPVNEPDGTVTISVERINGSGGAVAVDYASSDGSAVAGVDYIAASGTLNWAANDTITKTFAVTVNDDLLIEGDEVFNMTLSNAVGAALGAPSAATVTVTSDDQTGTIQLSSAAYSDLENAGLITVTVSRIGGTVGDVAVYYQTRADGGLNPATVNVDYTEILPTRVEWLSGDGADKTFNIIIPDDSDYEADETFLVELINPENTVVTSPGVAVVTISNEDSPTPTTMTIIPGWSLISVPTDLASITDMASLFGDDLGKAPAVYRRLSNNVPGAFAGTYVIADIAIPGEGYFLLNDRTVSVTLDDQYNGLQTTDPYEITLQVGGSIIGNPYQTPVDLLIDARVCNSTTSGGCTLPTDWVDWSTAATNGWVTGTIYGYDTATSNYVLKNPADLTMMLAPWEAYWVRTETSNVIKLRFYDLATPP